MEEIFREDIIKWPWTNETSLFSHLSIKTQEKVVYIPMIKKLELLMKKMSSKAEI